MIDLDWLKEESSEYRVQKELDYHKAVKGSRRNMNVLGVIVFCFVFGGVLASMGKEAEVLVRMFEALNGCCVKMIKLVMLYDSI